MAQQQCHTEPTLLRNVVPGATAAREWLAVTVCRARVTAARGHSVRRCVVRHNVAKFALRQLVVTPDRAVMPVPAVKKVAAASAAIQAAPAAVDLPARVAGVGALLFGLGLAILPLAPGVPLAVLSVVVWTTGEMLFAPFAGGWIVTSVKKAKGDNPAQVYMDIYPPVKIEQEIKTRTNGGASGLGAA